MINYKVTKVDLKDNTVDIFTSKMNTNNIEIVKNYYNNFNDGCVYFISDINDSDYNIYDTLEKIFYDKYNQCDLTNIFCLMGYCKLKELKIKDLIFTCSPDYNLDSEIEKMSKCVVYKDNKVIYGNI